MTTSAKLSLPFSTSTLSGVTLEPYADAAAAAQKIAIGTLGRTDPGGDMRIPYFTYLLHCVAAVHSPSIPHYWRLPETEKGMNAAFAAIAEQAADRAAKTAANLLQEKSFGLATVGQRLFYDGNDQECRKHALWALACDANWGGFKRPDYVAQIPDRLANAIYDVARTAPSRTLRGYTISERRLLADIAAPVALPVVDRWIGNHRALATAIAAHNDGADNLDTILHVNRLTVADGATLDAVNRCISISDCTGYTSAPHAAIAAAAAHDAARHRDAVTLARRFPQSAQATMRPTAHDVVLLGSDNIRLLGLTRDAETTFTAMPSAAVAGTRHPAQSRSPLLQA